LRYVLDCGDWQSLFNLDLARRSIILLSTAHYFLIASIYLYCFSSSDCFFPDLFSVDITLLLTVATLRKEDDAANRLWGLAWLVIRHGCIWL
jgi:hypothetical protein